MLLVSYTASLDPIIQQRSTRSAPTPTEPFARNACAFFTAPCAWLAAAELFRAAVTAPDRQPERLCAFSSFSCAAMAAAESSESSEDETLPVAQLRIVRPAGRGATDLTLPLCARVALVKVKLEHELGVPEADQRLIYGGKVLTDAQTLGDIVQNKEGRQTFHLVVPPPPPAPAPPPASTYALSALAA